ncbi:MAG: hypothetical protein M1610_03945 [Nitrospirae bacterium]|jgi:hypothetical protein|nr:hypothetical protein [Nitrospirota bacterium]MCL5063416.1 hypothetical protein [Nitrospirota bacterium]MDA8214615.1 hypothetical protein [Nitrospiraceae bacterium]MDA8338408.1 hypothetical protein [Nitrospiraceae bacterium]
MSKRGHLLLAVQLLLIVIFLLLGCISTITVKQDSVKFRERAEKLPLSVGLFLSDTMKNYLMPGEIASDTLNFEIGKAIEASAIESLKKVFHDVSLIQEKAAISPNIQRIVIIEFSPSSKFIYGGATLSEHTATVELLCEVYDRKWNILWKGTANGSVTRTTGEAGVASLIIGMLGESIQLKELGKIVNESLTAALENLNDQIMILGKDAIMGNKK